MTSSNGSVHFAAQRVASAAAELWRRSNEREIKHLFALTSDPSLLAYGLEPLDLLCSG